MFSTIIVRLKFPEKIFIFCLFFLLHSFIPTVKASFLDGIIQFPTVRGSTLKCNADDFSTYIVYDTFASQTGAFIPILGLLFTVAVYGTKSVFDYKSTFIIDDIVIFTSSLAPILSWYTLVKPVWLFVIVKERLFKEDVKDTGKFKDLNTISLMLIGSFLLVLILMAIIRFYFVKFNNKHLLNQLKTFVIWIYFFHSLEVITFSILEYIFIFSDMIKTQNELAQQVQIGRTESSNILGITINFLFLNWFMNICYLFTSLFLVASYHFPSLEKMLLSKELLNNEFIKSRIKTEGRNFRGFIRKKTFFFTVTLSISHIFFEYDWFCTPPFFSIIFNTILTTVLTRSITSFFSSNGMFKNIHKHQNKDKNCCKVYAQIQLKDIGKFNNFYYDKNGKLEEYKVVTREGHYYVIKDKNELHVVIDSESVYLVNNRNDVLKEIRESIKSMNNDDCDRNNRKSSRIDHDCENIENFEQEQRKIIDKYDKEEIKDRVFVDVLETGLLNYIIYSHRGTTNAKRKDDENFNILHIIIIMIFMSMLCTPCILFALSILYQNHNFTIGMIVCGLFTLLALFFLRHVLANINKKDKVAAA